MNRKAPSPCKTPKCGRNTRDKSRLCAKCRYHEEMDKTEVRYEVAVAKGVPIAAEVVHGE